MKFIEQAIDFTSSIRAYEAKYAKYKNKHGKLRPASRERFGAPIIKLAKNVVPQTRNFLEMKGIRKCIHHEITMISYRQYIWIIPSSVYNYPFSSINSDDRMFVNLLAEPIILNTIKYQDALKEYHTGLASIIFWRLTTCLENLIDNFYLRGPMDFSEEYCDWVKFFDTEEIKSLVKEQGIERSK